MSLSHLTQATVPKAGAVAVLPLGAMETHGPHLPLGTDNLIAEGILNRAAELDTHDAQILRLPAMWLGASAEHADHPGTLSLEPEQVVAQIVNIGEGLTRSGVTRVMVFNAHGGNVAACAMAALKLRTRFNMLAAGVHWLDFGLPPGLVPPAPEADDVHGGWIETSVMLHLAPHLVVEEVRAARPAQTPAPSLFPSGPVNWGWKIDDLAPSDGKTGWIGRPDLATAALGKTLVDHAAQCVVKALHDIAATRIELR
ncbi:MAG: creatininase family protein [Rhodospirillaceae bacterium]|nr:creatininase family protein [Rhodospirillaceae bacterium]